MATKKPRIQVTLKTAEYELVKRLAKLQGRPMSKVLSDLFEEIAPVYERVAVVLQAAQRAQASAHDGMREAAHRAEAEIAPHLAAAIGQFDMLERELGIPGGSGLAAAVGGGDPSSRTPASVTRGSALPGHPPQERKRAPKPSPRRHAKRKSVHGLAAAIARKVRSGPKGKRA
jgi:hypothetical protein